MPRSLGFGSTKHLKLARSVRAAGSGQDARHIVGAVKGVSDIISSTVLRKKKRQYQELKERVAECQAQLNLLEDEFEAKSTGIFFLPLFIFSFFPHRLYILYRFNSDALWLK